MVLEIPTKQTLLIHQRNELFKEITEQGLNPKEFNWETEASGMGLYRVPKLVHSQTGYFFKFDVDSDGKRISYYYPTLEAEKRLLIPGNWKYQKLQFLIWINIMKIELTSPDFWEYIEEEKKLIVKLIEKEPDNDPLSDVERTFIAIKLNEIEQIVISNNNLSHKDISLIRERINYLVECSKYFGRKDWIYVSIGVFSILTSIIQLSPNNTKKMVILFKEILNTLLQSGIFIP